MRKKIRVLQVIPELGYGGAETGCYDLAHFLSEHDCKSFIITSGGELLKFIKKKRILGIEFTISRPNYLISFFLGVKSEMKYF